MKAVGCSCSVGSARIKLSRGTAWIYNLFSRILERKLKNKVGGGNGLVNIQFLIQKVVELNA